VLCFVVTKDSTRALTHFDRSNDVFIHYHFAVSFTFIAFIAFLFCFVSRINLSASLNKLFIFTLNFHVSLQNLPQSRIVVLIISSRFISFLIYSCQIVFEELALLWSLRKTHTGHQLITCGNLVLSPADATRSIDQADNSIDNNFLCNGYLEIIAQSF
jgi:hypothetical protein